MLYLLAFEPKPGLPDAPRKPFDRFAGAHELSVDARSLEGWRIQAGRQRWEPIFTARGTYQFRVADDVMAAAAADTSFCSLTRK